MWKYLKRYVVFMILAPLFMMGEVCMDLLQPQLMSIIIDDGVLGLSNNNVGDVNLVITTGIKMVGLVVIGGFCGVMSGVFANLASQNFGNDVRKATFKKVMSFSFEQTDMFTTGSLITRVTNDITQVQNLVSQCIRGFVRTFMLFGGGIVCMLSLGMSFGVVIACALPFVLILVIYFIAKANPMYGVLQTKIDKVNNVMQENVSGSRVVKAYVKEKYEQNRFGEANNDLSNKQLDVLLLFSYMSPIMNIILNVSVIAIIKVGSIQVQAGSVTPGEVMAAITYVSQILNAVMRLAMIFQSVSRGVASGKRIQEVLNSTPPIVDGPFAEETNVKGKVEFKNVCFSYPDASDELVLRNLNLTIHPGETLAVLGSTGCGKSSLINLIPRFYDVTQGQILVDGVDVREYRLDLLRSKIAVALQKSEIFSTTIGENIKLGKPDATDEMVEKAATVAQAMEFIENKPEKMDTQVNQGGTSLSGGQKQRVAIARAILKEAEILIFDDSTSALDLKTEANLYAALNKNYDNMTKIIIAQRIASVKDADRIAVLENGSIVSCDTHENLLKNCEIYQAIYNSQLKGGEDYGRE